MGKRELFEIPTINFTPVTLLGGANSCPEPTDCDGYNSNDGVFIRQGEDNNGDDEQDICTPLKS